MEKSVSRQTGLLLLWAHLSGRVEWKVSTTLSCSCYPALSPDLSRGDKESPLTMAQNLLASLHFRRLLMEICNWNVIVSKLSRFVCVLTWEVALGYEARQPKEEGYWDADTIPIIGNALRVCALLIKCFTVEFIGFHALICKESATDTIVMCSLLIRLEFFYKILTMTIG